MIVDCQTLAARIGERTREGVALLASQGLRPRILEVIATSNQGVISYSNTKKRNAEALGIDYVVRDYDQNVTTQTLIEDIRQINVDSTVHGIIIGLPLFVHLDEKALVCELNCKKDVDGLGPFNTYCLSSKLGEGFGLIPATARAAVHVLEKLGELSGKKVSVLGRGATVGRPTAQMLVNRDATVTIAHSRTTDLEKIVRESEIVVSATGRPGLVNPDWFRPGQIVVDCGISFIDGRTIGDIDSKAADAKGAVITPVPRGVGLITNAMVFSNLIKAIQLQQAR